MFTRKDYLSKKCTHEQYYGQFVTDSVKKNVWGAFKKQILAGLPANETRESLAYWDKLGLPYGAIELLKSANDSYTLNTAICTNKQAYKQLLIEQGSLK